MDWGEAFKGIVAAAQSVGVDPETLPCVAAFAEPADHLRFEWSAFAALSSDRQVGMGVGPIAWSSIDRLAERYQIQGDDFERLAAILMAMDLAYRNHLKSEP